MKNMFEHAMVDRTSYTEDGVCIAALCSREDYDRYRQYVR